MAKIRPTKKGFMNWLSSKPTNRIVGRRCSPYECPMANYLNTLTDERVFVAASSYSVKGQVYHQTSWAYNFITTLDSTHVEDSFVSAGQAIQILKSV